MRVAPMYPKMKRHIDAPCLDCEERTAECHSVCPKYIAYRDENIERSREIKAKVVKEQMLQRYEVEEAMKKKKNKRYPNAGKGW